MRRLLLIFLMCLLPLQWSWAAAGGVCEHETGNAHFGHHEHQHHADKVTSPGADVDASHQVSDNHPDCQACHGLGAAFLQATGAAPALKTARSAWPAYGGVIPEPPIECLLRPPLPLVA